MVSALLILGLEVLRAEDATNVGEHDEHGECDGALGGSGAVDAEPGAVDGLPCAGEGQSRNEDAKLEELVLGAGQNQVSDLWMSSISEGNRCDFDKAYRKAPDEQNTNKEGDASLAGHIRKDTKCQADGDLQPTTNGDHTICFELGVSFLDKLRCVLQPG